uniref:Uncharacterized protein n=1 Tax=Avena sativa TaxID=4498 RepID=A0ACD5W4S2_AVESA
MDDGMRNLRVRFSGVGQEDQGSGQTRTMPPQQQGTPFGRGHPSPGEEYDAAYAATVAAVAYAISAREEEEKAPSQGRKHVPEKVPSRKKNVTVHTPASAPPLLENPPKRGESMKRPMDGSMISRWFSGKELGEDGDDDEQRANVSVRRPVKPAQKKPEGLITPAGQNVVGKVADSAPNLEKEPRKRSRRFEQEQANPRPAAPQVSNPTASFPRDQRKDSRRYEQEAASQRVPPTGRPSGVAFTSESEAMAAAWEKERMARIKEKYNETMQTIAEWEDEKKAKARRQKEPREQGDSESKRAKALEEYNDEMQRINKVAAASRLTAEEKKSSAEGKVRAKAAKIRSTGKLPRTCGCF